VTSLYEPLPDELQGGDEPDYDEDDLALLEEDEPGDQIVLDESQAEFIDTLVKRCLLFIEEFNDVRFYPYQTEVSYRICESVIINDAEELTGLISRQAGKTETLANTFAGLMVLLPKLALSFELLARFKKGLWIGCFAPTEDQSDTLHGRIVDRLTSDHALNFLMDPEIDDEVKGKGKVIRLKNGSLARRQTCNPKAKIEGKTYHVIVIDEAQDADADVVRKSVHPMMAATAGTMVKIGTPARVKGDFYRAIQQNKRRFTSRARRRQNHFEYDWKIVAKYNPSYARYIQKEKARLGEDSDEFQMSYAIRWLLDRGQFVTDEVMDALFDPSMPLVRSWYRSPCVAGIDPARLRDSTVVTVCWVDWEYPDPFGFREHRVLNWLELHNQPWEEQYFRICEFLDNYKLAYVGVDAQAMGSAIAERLQHLLGSRCEVIGMASDVKTQGVRWKNLQTLIDRRLMVYPGHSKARRTRVYQRFRQQMSDAIKVFRAGQMLVEAPQEQEAHDDYVDSLALACAASMIEAVPTVEVAESPFFAAR
jgi:hypothetical protein